MKCTWCDKEFPKKELVSIGECHLCMACKVLIEEALRNLRRKLCIKEADK